MGKAMQPLGPEAVREQLTRILASRVMARSDQRARLLRYLVEQALEGGNGTVKETVIGIDVFGRPPDWDPQSDSVVRMHAARLRDKLREYYATEGQSDPVVLEIPKGAYLPQWRPADTTPPQSAVVARPRWYRWAIMGACVLVALLGGWALWKAIFPAAIRSVAVLPLRSLDDKKEGDLFSDGLTEDLVLDLSAIPNLRVISSTSSFALRGTTKTLREVGALLDVEALVEGSIRVNGGRMQAVVRLVRAADDTVVWSGAFDREQRDLAGLQKELASRITVALQPRLRNVALAAPAMDPEAYQLYLRGLASHRKYTLPDLKQAVRYFEQAAEKDPRSPRPWFALGGSYMRLSFVGQGTRREGAERAQAAARRALEIDARCAEAHAVMGIAYWYGWSDAKAADAEFRQAIALNPNSAWALDAYGVFLLRQDRKAEGQDASLRAQRLDPLNSDISLHLFYAYRANRRYDDALALALRERDRLPGSYDARVGLVLLSKGDCAGAVEAFRRAKLTKPDVDVAVALACSGNSDEARQELARLEQEAAAGKKPLSHVARVYFALGEKSGALDWLERLAQSSTRLSGMRFDEKVWDPLRSEPRFQALQQRIAADE